MRRRTVALLAVALGIGGTAVTGTAFAIGAVGQSDSGTTVTPAPVRDFSEELTHDLAVADEPSTTVPPDDVSVTSRLRGANPDGARLARQSPGGGSVYVLPAADGLCLSSTSGVEDGCFDGATVSAASVICAPGLPVDEVEVFGVAPDGLSAVTVELKDGSARSASVEGNVFIYRASKSQPPPLAISWTEESGKSASIPANVPKDFREDRCATPADNVSSDGPPPRPDSELFTDLPPSH